MAIRRLPDRHCAWCGRTFRPATAIRKFCSRSCSSSRKASLADLFWRHVVTGEGCWEWRASVTGTGYGKLTVGGRSERRQLTASRVSWELHNGPVPPDLFVLHHCDNRKCVRPDHLHLGTKRDNTREAMERGRLRPGGRAFTYVA